MNVEKFTVVVFPVVILTHVSYTQLYNFNNRAFDTINIIIIKIHTATHNKPN